ncbi:hypothetical protein U1Q18_024879 [Sarracenia purpurea var. burkii]
MTTTTTTSLSLLWFPFPFAFSHQASSNLSIPTSNPNPFNDFWSFHSSASSSSYSRKLCLGRRSISFRSQSNLSSRRLTWLSGYTKRDQNMDNGMNEDVNRLQMFGSNEEVTTQIPTQAQTIVKGSGEVLVSEYKPVPDVDYLQELLAIQQQGPRAIGFFGTRNIGFMHQQLIEILSYAMVITV